jgi:uncharacterized protein (TIGR03437 family)
MRALLPFALLALASAPMPAADSTCPPNNPCYFAAGIVNAASNQAGVLAPNTWVSIYGTNLATATCSRDAQGNLPCFGGVKVLIGQDTANGEEALLSYVSPSQVNFLMPWQRGNAVTVQLARDSLEGPAIRIALADYAPGLFLVDASTAVAVHPNWTVVTPASPAHAGEYVILYATGLGPFALSLDDEDNAVPMIADPITARKQFTILLDGKPVDDELIEYVGAAPLFIGDYQINLKLPASVGPNPEIRLSIGGSLSPAGIHLIVQ